MAFGVPYAFHRVVDGRVYTVCPSCGELIRENWDEHGEHTSNNYGLHWEEKKHDEPGTR